MWVTPVSVKVTLTIIERLRANHCTSSRILWLTGAVWRLNVVPFRLFCFRLKACDNNVSTLAAFNVCVTFPCSFSFLIWAIFTPLVQWWSLELGQGCALMTVTRFVALREESELFDKYRSFSFFWLILLLMVSFGNWICKCLFEEDKYRLYAIAIDKGTANYGFWQNLIFDDGGKNLQIHRPSIKRPLSLGNETYPPLRKRISF